MNAATATATAKVKCSHTDANICKCPCHDATETGEPAIIHMIECCVQCPICGRMIDEQPEGLIS